MKDRNGKPVQRGTRVRRVGGPNDGEVGTVHRVTESLHGEAGQHGALVYDCGLDVNPVNSNDWTWGSWCRPNELEVEPEFATQLRASVALLGGKQ
jgi:hypothetical protein